MGGCGLSQAAAQAQDDEHQLLQPARRHGPAQTAGSIPSVASATRRLQGARASTCRSTCSLSAISSTGLPGMALIPIRCPTACQKRNRCSCSRSVGPASRIDSASGSARPRRWRARSGSHRCRWCSGRGSACAVAGRTHRCDPAVRRSRPAEGLEQGQLKGAGEIPGEHHAGELVARPSAGQSSLSRILAKASSLADPSTLFSTTWTINSRLSKASAQTS